MPALRRAATLSARGHSISIMVARGCFHGSELSRNSLVQEKGNFHLCFGILEYFSLSKSYSSRCPNFTRSLLWSRNLSSHVGAISGEKDNDSEDRFSELDEPAEDMVEPDERVENKEFETEEGILGGESDFVGNRSLGKRIESPLSMAIIRAPRYSLNSVLNKWVKHGNPLGRGEISVAMLILRKRRLYAKALQFIEWLEENKQIEFLERDYASRLDLVCKLNGLQKAENYLEKIPVSLQGEVVYRTLLANCALANNLRKAEEVFNKIKDLGLPITKFTCNQLLMLYKRVDQKKIADVLAMMEKENIKPCLLTYRLLIDAKCRASDISGMEQIIDTMKAKGLKPDLTIQGMAVKYYSLAGLNEKAEAVLKEIEGDHVEENHVARKVLLPLYAALGKADDVGRIWEICKSSQRLDEYLAAIKAWGKLGNVEKAEEVFEDMIKVWTKVSAKHYVALLNVYASNKLQSKGKDFAKRMSDDGCHIGPPTWDALVKLYAEAGELEKADSILQKASQCTEDRPLFMSYMALLEKYSKRGDIHNAEKIFQRLRQARYVGRLKPYQYLLQAYINAKKPAYGFRGRMKADNMFPNKAMIALLKAADALIKPQSSDLLD
ncbi:pentatricopeptide repeat-containing protein At1g80270, mitochondrial-like [Curcuma longa]|uniref:pentatricopeptide repeat-containing protein At1g80270, mitochondrial-like n=1 Tax=Curcuma longa TaxID=136217 RepID=UPI003D9DB275